MTFQYCGKFLLPSLFVFFQSLVHVAALLVPSLERRGQRRGGGHRTALFCGDPDVPMNTSQLAAGENGRFHHPPPVDSVYRLRARRFVRSLKRNQAAPVLMGDCENAHVGLFDPERSAAAPGSLTPPLLGGDASKIIQ